MKLGDQVILYTHESHDLGPDITRDELAFVTGVVSDACLDVVVFPPKGPIRFERVCAFDPDNPYNYPGGVYWRGVGDDAPDFDGYFAYADDPRWRSLLFRQRAEADAAPSQQKAALREKHIAQQDELTKQIDEERGPAEPEHQERRT